jgi:hypothetical protein
MIADIVPADIVPVDIPVDPDDEQARKWLEEELNRGGQAPEPADPPQWWIDFLNWLRDLFGGNGAQPPGQVADTGGTVGIVIIIVLIVVALLVAFWIFGLPRLRKRSKVTGDLFGDDDERSAEQLRSAAQKAADAGDYTTAVVESFRSLARDLAERGFVLTFPGTTARDFARRAADLFDGTHDRLLEAADVFDAVRYLGAVGTLEQWRRMSALERELRTARRPRAPRAADAFEGAS